MLSRFVIFFLLEETPFPFVSGFFAATERSRETLTYFLLLALLDFPANFEGYFLEVADLLLPRFSLFSPFFSVSFLSSVPFFTSSDIFLAFASIYFASNSSFYALTVSFLACSSLNLVYFANSDSFYFF